MTRAAYQSLGHAVVAAPTRSNSLLEDAIERLRIRRRIVLSTPGHLSLPAIIAATDLVASVPPGTAVDLARNRSARASIPLVHVFEVDLPATV